MPLPTNTRCWANMIFVKAKDRKPWFGLEQEYYIFDQKTQQPMGVDNKNIKQGTFIVKWGNKYGRFIAEKHCNIA